MSKIQYAYSVCQQHQHIPIISQAIYLCLLHTNEHSCSHKTFIYATKSAAYNLHGT